MKIRMKKLLACAMSVCLLAGSTSALTFADEIDLEYGLEAAETVETETFETETETEAASETDTEAIKESEVETEEIEAESEETVIETETETESETETETETETEIEGELTWERAQELGMTYNEYLDYCAAHYEPEEGVELMTTASVTFAQLNAASVFISQDYDGDGSCVWSAVTSMVRRASMLSGNKNWSSLTKAVVGAACGGSYVRHSFSVGGISVGYRSFSGDKDDLIQLLAAHPEGIVIYDSKMPHAVLLTDRTDGAFYCSEPVTSYFVNRGPRIKLVDSSLNRKYYGSGKVIGLTQIIDNITGYWYVTSPTGLKVLPSMSTAKVRNVSAVPAGNKACKITWSAKSGASGYSIYAEKEGVYAKVASVGAGKTSYIDYMALDTAVNKYYVFAYAYKTSGKKYFTDKSDCAKAKGICPAVKDLKATGVTGGVKLTWTKAKDSEGYLIYKKNSDGSFKLIGKTGYAKYTYTDKSASKTKNNYYRVYSYHHDGSGKIIKGKTPVTVYAKAK